MWLVPRKMGRDPFNQNFRKFRSKTRSRLLPKLDGSVRSNQKSFENTDPPFEVDHFSRSHRSEFWLNGSHPWTLEIWADPPYWRSLQFDSFWIRVYKLHIRFIGPVVSQIPVRQITKSPIFKTCLPKTFLNLGHSETAFPLQNCLPDWEGVKDQRLMTSYNASWFAQPSLLILLPFCKSFYILANHSTSYLSIRPVIGQTVVKANLVVLKRKKWYKKIFDKVNFGYIFYTYL